MTTALNQQRLETIREIVAEHLDVEAADITERGRFKEDHGADSLRMMDVLAALETKFDIDIHEDLLEEMVDLHSTCEIVSELAAG